MNVEGATMTMPYPEAAQAFRAYQALLSSPKASREDLMLYRAYRALVRGRKVIDAHHAIARAGVDVNGRPKLAICRADVTWCALETWMLNGEETAVFSHRGGRWTLRRRRDHQLLAGEVGIPVRMFNRTGITPGRARVPLIPAQHRPTAQLDGFHILWEAEWEDVPVDPLLLKHVDGPFYVVLAAWDLSLVEQSVLRMRA